MTCGVEINKDAWHIHVKKKTESKVIVNNMTHTCNGTRMNDNYMTRVESCSCHCQRISTIVIYINLFDHFQIFIPILVSQLYVEDNVYVYIPILILAGFSIAVALLLPW